MSKVNKSEMETSVMMITRNGVAKKCAASSFKDVRRSGIIAIKLDAGDELLSTVFTSSSDSVIVITLDGQSIRFADSDVREMGRQAGGVIAIKLDQGDRVISAQSIPANSKGAKLLIMTGNGFGKMTLLSEYKIQKRGGVGIKTVKVTDKTGKLMVARVVLGGEEEILAISRGSVVIRTPIKHVPTLGRDTQGVRIMKPKDGDSIASLNLL